MGIRTTLSGILLRIGRAAEGSRDLRRELRGTEWLDRQNLWRSMLEDAADRWPGPAVAAAGASPIVPISARREATGDFASDRPFLDWLAEMIESGQLQEFLEFLFSLIDDFVKELLDIL